MEDVGVSILALLSLYGKVYAVEIILEKVEIINNHKDSIKDNYNKKIWREKNVFEGND